MAGREMQIRLRSKIIDTRQGEALTFGFRLGPIAIFIIANLPEHDRSKEGPLVYVKMDFRPTEDWAEHSVESLRKERR